MESSIAVRIKSRNKQRLQEVIKKRKKLETEATAASSSLKRRRRRVSYDSDIEDLTPVFNNEIKDVVHEVSDKNSPGLRTWSEEDKFVNGIRDLEEKKSELDKIEISSDSETESEEKGLRNKRVFEMNNTVIYSVSEDETEEEEDSDDKNSEDSITADSESSEDLPSSSSSSSDDEEFSLEEDTDDNDDDDLRKASSWVRKASKEERKPLRKFKRAKTFGFTKYRKEAIDEKKDEKLNSRGDEEDEVERVTQPQSNVGFVCVHCGNDNTVISDSHSSFIRPHDRRVEDEDMNQFASNNLSKYEDSVSINYGKTHEQPSKPESKNSEKDKEEKTPENPSIAEVEKSDTGKEMKTPEFLPSRPETENWKTGKKLKTTEFQSSRPETEKSETRKEVKSPDLHPSRHEIENSEIPKEVQASEKPSTSEIKNSKKAKDVQANNSLGLRFPPVAEGFNKSVLVNELIDDEVASISFAHKANKTRNEPEPSPKGKEIKFNKSALVNEFIDDEVASISFADKPINESQPSQKGKEIKVNNSENWSMMGRRSKDLDAFRLLVNSIWEKDRVVGEEDELVSSPKDQSRVLQGNEDTRKYDDDGLLIIRPPPLIENFGQEEPEPPPVISESEMEENKLWEEMEFLLKSIEMDKESSTTESPATTPCQKGNHELHLDLEIGLKCIHCSYLVTEIRDMDVYEWGGMNTSRRRKIDRYEEEGSSLIGKLGFEAPSKNNLHGFAALEGTVWDKIPGIKSQLYPHQQEGFEFIWRNLAGTIVLNELKNFENSDETGGCIMSHAPGTGKTRLTITFLQSYLQCFPDCKPVIIAPASLLLTWAEEFKKWNTSIPFHNLNNLEFSGRESLMALRLFEQKSSISTNETRMVKIYSWIKGKSILGISYSLYEKLAGEKVENKKKKKVREVKPNKEEEDIRRILLGVPGLLVLDEAHTPRNQRSCIWQTLSKVGTQKRILLSGTPFQNNFLELNNVLGLARPKYVKMLSSTLKKSMMTVKKRGRQGLGDSEDEINNNGIEELKAVMLPFVHVHKGSILQKSLPGLRDCVVVLNPPELQKRVLEAIEVSQTVFEVEYKQALVSIHPSLVSCCAISEKERLILNEAFLAQLQKIKFDPNQSVKTRFLTEFIRLCNVINEKVLVFSQYVKPLLLIKKQLESRFDWREEEEVLCMYGKINQNQRQTLINRFNDHKSRAKVFLASTKACSEGINLVGASRVILLDVVWNPAVERQAISRAYRIGQQRMVYTYHLVTKGTPECHKYCKQAEKHRLSELVFASSSKHEKGKEKIGAAVTEDKVLDSMVQHLQLGEMFDKLIYQPKEADLVEGFSLLMP